MIKTIKKLSPDKIFYFGRVESIKKRKSGAFHIALSGVNFIFTPVNKITGRINLSYKTVKGLVEHHEIKPGTPLLIGGTEIKNGISFGFSIFKEAFFEVENETILMGWINSVNPHNHDILINIPVYDTASRRRVMFQKKMKITTKDIRKVSEKAVIVASGYETNEIGFVANQYSIEAV